MRNVLKGTDVGRELKAEGQAGIISELVQDRFGKVDATVVAALAELDAAAAYGMIKSSTDLGDLRDRVGGLKIAS